MILKILLLMLLAALAICLFVSADAPVPMLVVPVLVTEIYDGDTPIVEVTFKMRVRLMDCWCQEITGKEKTEGLKAKKRMEELALGKNGLLTIPLFYDIGQSTNLSRVKGRLSVDGKDLSEVMVEEKFATKTKVKK